MADNDTDLLELTAEIVTALVGDNGVATAELPQLITGVYQALSGLGEQPVVAEPKYEPVVSVRKSLANPAHILSMIDGKPYKSLRRHLRTHGIDEAEYRRRYKLPGDYPMVAPVYSEARRGLAKQIGLGRKRREELQGGGAEPAQESGTDGAATKRPVLKIGGRKLSGAEALAKVRGDNGS